MRHDLARELHAALPAFLPDLVQRNARAGLRRAVGHHLQLAVAVGREAVHRDDNGDAELPNVFNVSLEIRQAALERAEFLRLETVLVARRH